MTAAGEAAAAAAPVPATNGFGPSALATPANAITLFRLALSPLLFAMILDAADSWATIALWVVLAGSDGLDGFLARRHGTTRSGAFLDPLADKVLVLGAMVALVVADRFWWLPVALTAGRELTIQGFRSYWGRRGLAVPARRSAKLKTFVQELAVGFAVLPTTAERATWMATSLLWISVAVALFSAAQYVHEGSRATRTMARGE